MSPLVSYHELADKTTVLPGTTQDAAAHPDLTARLPKCMGECTPKESPW
jgi:hypothetical protein